MTELWQAIYAHNRRMKVRQAKLEALQALLPPPDEILTFPEALSLLNRFRKVLDTI